VIKGPSVVNDTLVGITSFGDGCSNINFPGVYTRLRFYDDWIEDQICLLSDFRPESCPSLPPSNAPTITGAPTSPTASPVPTISTPPSQAPTRRPGFSFCFSGESTIETQNKGTIKMDQLELGDKVLADNDVYEEVYSFGHHNKDMQGEYLQIATVSKRKLELTPDHMVFVEGDHAVPASAVEVGDKLMVSGGQLDVVKSIKTVVRKGAYAPFTASGTLMVNDVKSSSFVAFQGAEYLQLGGTSTFLSYQWLAHAFEAPHRLACRMGLCQTESYTPEGVSRWVYAPLKISQWFLQQSPVVMAMMVLPLVTLFGAVWTVEQFPFATVLMLMLGAAALSLSSMRIQKVKQI